MASARRAACSLVDQLAVVLLASINVCVEKFSVNGNPTVALLTLNVVAPTNRSINSVLNNLLSNGSIFFLKKLSISIFTLC